MAWVYKAERFNEGPASPKGNATGEVSALSLGSSAKDRTPQSPGPYVGHSTFSNVRPSYAPFGSTKVREGPVSKAKELDGGPPPGAYDPKLPKRYDAGLPRKHVPFSTGALRSGMAKEGDIAPGPGQYVLSGRAPDRQACRTMGAPGGELKTIFRSASAPSIPQGHQSYGYEESGDGKLVRQGPKGQVYLSGRPEDSAGPGQYAPSRDFVAPKPAGGRFLGGALRDSSRPPPSDLPGPGHYIADKPRKGNAVSSSFVSQTDGRGLGGKTEKKIADMPGPGHYRQDTSNRPSLREQHPELQYFGSTAERFKDEPASRQPGPGAYHGAGKRFSSGGKPSWGQQGRFRQTKDSSQPGPGAYEGVPGVATAALLSTASILGSTGNLAFGSHETKRGPDLKDSWAPGPGAYGSPNGTFDEAETTPAGKRAMRPRPRIQHASFKSETAKDALVAQMAKEGTMGPPPGAYSPKHVQEISAVMRLPPKGEGFGSAASRLEEAAKPSLGPGPGWYKVPISITAGKKHDTFNRAALEGAPDHGRPRGMGFSTQEGRFKDAAAAKAPGPGDYNYEPGLITKTFNIHFGDVI